MEEIKSMNTRVGMHTVVEMLRDIIDLKIRPKLSLFSPPYQETGNFCIIANGWKLCFFNSHNHIDYLDLIVDPQGNKTHFEDFTESNPVFLLSEDEVLELEDKLKYIG